MNFKKIFVLCLIFLLFPFCIASADDIILYISDHDPDNDFSKRYVNTLQSFISRNKKNKKVRIERFLGIDINTTESLELFSMFNRKIIPKTLILMVGESNYYNVYGFAKFMNARQSAERSGDEQEKDLYKLNSKMEKIYEPHKQVPVNPSVKAACNAAVPVPDKKVFHPGVFPEFYFLKERDKFEANDSNVLSTTQLYKHAWELIRNEQFDIVKEFLGNIIRTNPSRSMFYYALSSAYLAENAKDCEKKALKCLEDGILVDPFNKENVCYKGMMSMFMMYKGEITAEILFFSRSLNECFLNISDEISAINAINTPDYDSKIEIIDDWILFDFDEIQKRCYRLEVPFIFASYPDNDNINSLVHEHLRNSSKSSYIENKIGKVKDVEGEHSLEEGETLEETEDSDSYIYGIAEKMYNFLQDKGIVY